MSIVHASGTWLEIDGAYGEGGGQLIRNALALSAITGRALRVYNIRRGRERPGLAAQHLAAARALAEICGATADGLALRSQQLSFSPGPLRGGNYRFNIGTAGSVTLVLQALLPAMVAAGEDFDVTVTGGTDVPAAPPIDYFREVLLAHLARMGVRMDASVHRRGYYPAGGGEVQVRIQSSRLQSCTIDAPGPLLSVSGQAHVSGLPRDIAARMRAAAVMRLPEICAGATAINAAVDAQQAFGRGGAIVAWASCSQSTLGAGRVAERGKRAEELGASVGDELRADLESGAGVDIHAADQLLIYQALAGAGSYTTRQLSSHAQTAIWLIEQFLPVRFQTSSRGRLVRVAAAPA